MPLCQNISSFSYTFEKLIKTKLFTICYFKFSYDLYFRFYGLFRTLVFLVNQFYENNCSVHNLKALCAPNFISSWYINTITWSMLHWLFSRPCSYIKSLHIIIFYHKVYLEDSVNVHNVEAPNPKRVNSEKMFNQRGSRH